MIYVIAICIILYYSIIKKIFSKKDEFISEKMNNNADLFSNKNNNNQTNGDSFNYFNENRDKLFDELVKLQGKGCQNCKSKDNLQVHHKIPVSFGGSNEISNLKILCKNCHEKIHGYKFNNDYSRREIRSKKTSEIINAINNGNLVRIEYLDFNGNETNRVVKPLEVYKDRYYYVRGHCYLRNAERNFRISRIKEVDIIVND